MPRWSMYRKNRSWWSGPQRRQAAMSQGSMRFLRALARTWRRVPGYNTSPNNLLGPPRRKRPVSRSGHALYRLGHRAAGHAPSDSGAGPGGRLQPLLSYRPRSAGEEAFAKPVMKAGVLRTLLTLDHHVIEVTATAVADIDTYQDALDAGVTFSA